MSHNDNDMKIRLAAFDWVKNQSLKFDNAIPREILKSSFKYKNTIIPLVFQPGIWKPAIFDYPISITTTLRSKYDDVQTDDYLLYNYCRENDPYYRDNVALRKAMIDNRPLIYFVETVPGKYIAQFPAYIVGDNIKKEKFTVAFDDTRVEDANYVISDIRRQYVTREVKQRIHQSIFRERILHAYKCQCTLCKLRHRELLDAAHIIPDSEIHGVPKVTNGLSLCKIHHTAYDRNIIGITPDYKIKVREDILDEIDGPMLKHGIQALENNKLILPYHKKDWPDPERLEERFNDFQTF